MVLLKNDGVLPLKTSGIKIAVVGPLADQTKVLLGNYNGIPTHTVSILEGHAERSFRRARSTTFAGTQFLGHDAEPVPASALTIGRQAGRQGELLQARHDRASTTRQHRSRSLATRIEPDIDSAAQRRCQPQPPACKPLAIRWEATLTPARDRRLQPRARGRRLLPRCDSTARTSPPHGTADGMERPSWAACISKPASRTS